MLPRHELQKAIEIAKKYNIGKLYLVGSVVKGDPRKVNDYDFAIDGFPRRIFFNFYGELFGAMSKNVDLIDLSGKQTLFKKLVRRDGRLVYDKKKSNRKLQGRS